MKKTLLMLITISSVDIPSLNAFLTITDLTDASKTRSSFPRCRKQKVLNASSSTDECILNKDDDNDENKQHPETSLFELLRPNSKCDPKQMNPTTLAYIGDAVFELFVRSKYVWPSRRTTDLQSLVVGKVRAESQSELFQSILSRIELTQEEKTVVSRGRNAGAASGGRKRGPKRLYSSTTNNKDGSISGGPSVYQDSTAFEALIGYLYLTDGDRCRFFLEFSRDFMDDLDKSIPVVPS